MWQGVWQQHTVAACLLHGMHVAFFPGHNCKRSPEDCQTCEDLQKKPKRLSTCKDQSTKLLNTKDCSCAKDSFTTRIQNELVLLGFPCDRPLTISSVRSKGRSGSASAPTEAEALPCMLAWQAMHMPMLTA